MNSDKKNEINDRIVNNIYHLCEMKSIKIGDMERKIGVRIGYFSRKKKSQSTVGLLELYEATELLGVSLDEITNKNMYKDFAKEKLKKELVEIEKRKSEIEIALNELD